MELMEAERSRAGKEGGGSRGDLLLEGTDLSLFLITTNRSQFHMTTQTTRLGAVCVL